MPGAAPGVGPQRRGLPAISSSTGGSPSKRQISRGCQKRSSTTSDRIEAIEARMSTSQGPW
jgi:hypothetical protein